ncbi:toll/interleukin-1 receptor domain-containing protein [Mesorhizobium sp. M0904]|uniref:toll/interleukin-1 receptor domain-containing protein n=1 Tax=unclassified Mesorhizobium TaxID=325217 RepID=UPI0033362A3A
MTDFFISYTHADTAWAEWIGYVLEEAGLTVTIQAWDFRPGSNFVLEMQRAAAEAVRTILVLSPDYLKSQFTSPEWAAAFTSDPQGLNRKLVPVLVRPCQPIGLLTSLVQIRIIDMPEETARATLLAGIDSNRAKPLTRPNFPGLAGSVPHKDFPGPDRQDSAGGSRLTTILPNLKRIPTDAEKRRFIREGFEIIRALFEKNLNLAQQDPRIETDFQAVTTDFRAELFVDGGSKCACRVWMGGPFSDNGIQFSEGLRSNDNSFNELLTIDQEDGLHFAATMAMGLSEFERSINVKRMTAEQAADYLWHRFTSRLAPSW